MRGGSAAEEGTMYIGIDIGGTSVKMVLVDAKGALHGFRSFRTGSSAQAIERGIVDSAGALLASRRGGRHSLRGVGIGAPGQIDTGRGIIISSPNIPAWVRYPIATRVSALLGAPAAIENDATVAVMGEQWLGHGRSYRNWIMLTLGTGIGGGAVIDNAIYLGRSGSATEFGHTSIDYRGRPCPCGGRGCLERYAAAPAVVRLARRGLRTHPESSLHGLMQVEPLSAALLHQAARGGDRFAMDIFKTTGDFLGIGIAAFVNIFNPEAVVIGGGLSRAHRFFMPSLRTALARHALPAFRAGVRFHMARDVVRGAALGAAKLAVDRFS